MAAKTKTSFFCSNCGYESPKWLGQCPSCSEWNTLVEERVVKSSSGKAKVTSWGSPAERPTPKPLKDVVANQTIRFDTNDNELNRVLGGGLVSGSIVLIGGQPGIGKSTLLLQLALGIKTPVLYVSGEESEEQIKMRADRISDVPDTCMIYTDTDTERIIKHARQIKPGLVIIDSIQTMASPLLESAPGSISQVRDCTAEFQRYAKETNTPVFIIGHINKDGGIAGPKVLEHIVDVVLQFEGDQNHVYRILRTLKNRFGSTDELGIYAMETQGLRQVENPSEVLISQSDEDLSGSTIAASIEGQRPLLVETQALVTRSVYGTPQRSATGFDLRRLGMLLAVLEKRCGLPFATQDVFLNIVGGIKVSDPAIDLAVICSLISSLQDIAIGRNICFAAEIGLNGEIRAVSRVVQRIQEAQRLGFDTIYLSSFSMKNIDIAKYDIEIKSVSKVEDLLYEVFG